MQNYITWALLKFRRPKTIREIASASRIDKQEAAAQINRLLRLRLLEECPGRKCTISKSECATYKINKDNYDKWINGEKY